MKSLVDLSKHVLQVYLIQNFKLTTIPHFSSFSAPLPQNITLYHFLLQLANFFASLRFSELVFQDTFFFWHGSELHGYKTQLFIVSKTKGFRLSERFNFSASKTEPWRKDVLKFISKVNMTQIFKTRPFLIFQTESEDFIPSTQFTPVRQDWRKGKDQTEGLFCRKGQSKTKLNSGVSSVLLDSLWFFTVITVG